MKAAPSHLVVHLLTPGVPFVPLPSFAAFARQFLPSQFLQLFYETSSLVTVWLHWRTVPLHLQLDLHTAILKSAGFKSDSIIGLWQVYSWLQQLKITDCVNGTVMETECVSHSSILKKHEYEKRTLKKQRKNCLIHQKIKFIHLQKWLHPGQGHFRWFQILFLVQDRNTSWYTHTFPSYSLPLLLFLIELIILCKYINIWGQHRWPSRQLLFKMNEGMKNK